MIRTRWSNVKPRSIKEEIDKIDLKTDNWNVGEINKIYREMFSNYFSENITQRSYKTYAKKWHNDLKKLCNY